MFRILAACAGLLHGELRVHAQLGVPTHAVVVESEVQVETISLLIVLHGEQTSRLEVLEKEGCQLRLHIARDKRQRPTEGLTVCRLFESTREGNECHNLV